MPSPPIRLAIIGNCQAQAMRSLIYRAGGPFEIIELPEYHMMSLEVVDHVLQLLDSADLVMAQRVASNFRIEAVRPNNLRMFLGEKCILWPNIYFDGYFPGIRYVYGNDSRKLVGPLGDYHFEQIIGCWLHGLEPEVAAEQLVNIDGWSWSSGDPVQDSLAKLVQREADCHVGISDHIARNFAANKLMYAMNHPKNSVLLEMLDRMLIYAGLENGFRMRAIHQLERLAQIDIPLLPRYLCSQGQTLPEKLIFDGFSQPSNPSSPIRQRYSSIELVRNFYRLYQDNRHLLLPADWPS